MSTHSRIGIVNADKTVTSIFCHYDGYLSWVGVRLLTSYNTEAKVRELLTLGDLIQLGHKIGGQHKQGDPGTNDQCFAYRPRQRASGERVLTISRRKFLTLCAEYTYLFERGEWRVMHETNTWKPLDLEIIADRITS